MSGKLVYSTGGGKEKGGKKQGKKSFAKAEGPCKMRLEKKGRGGKTVTVLFNLPFDKAEAKSLMKDIQAKAGCGATLTQETIEFRGDLRDFVESYFVEKSMKIVRAGG